MRKPTANTLNEICRHHRVLEKAPGIAELGRVWQFFAANAADGITDCLRGRLQHTLLRQALAHRAVVQMGLQAVAQCKAHP
ncbi:hypothetical protein D3C71_2092700 [compost metagenome]